MKKLIALLAVCAFSGGAIAAQDAEITHDAELRLRYFQHLDQDMAEGGDSDTNDFNQRFKWGTTYRADENFSAHLTLLHNMSWGQDTPDADSGTAVHDGIGSNENMLLVNEAYGTWMMNDMMSLKFGRGSAVIGDGTVVSDNDWMPWRTTFDGFAFRYAMEAVDVNILYARFKDWDSLTSNEDDPNANLWGFSFDLKSLPEFLKMVNLHVMQVDVDQATGNGAPGGSSETRLRYGLTASGDSAGVDYRLTYAGHTGEFETVEIDRAGSMIDAELGYTVEDFWNSRFYVAYHMDSGDDDATDTEVGTYDSFYYERHANAGLMDVLMWGNLTYITIGWDFTPMDNLTAGLQYHMFSRTEEADSVNVGRNGIAAIASATGDETDIGSEIDLYATHTYEGGFSTTARLGMFTPGTHLEDNGIEDAYTQVFIEGKMTF